MGLTVAEIESLRQSPRPEECPAFNPSTDYIQKYWDLYLQNEQLMANLCNESLNRDLLLTDIMQIEVFYQENLERLSSERYLHNGRKRHNRRCAD